ncbi:carboxymuconolactone decarboxylase family protein [Halobacillus sp. Cin3]|uniref:carboxymuconolactone decarboxylase family protein n=1 Tax=Halobacillus sp. Cin3 TaxID=2928441 RepID=UPI00248E7386|nr:carboxymuconolactone decarboxylase family protein [Halobacillus sp. Cin3]
MPWIKPVKQQHMKEIRGEDEPSSLFDRLIANDPGLYEAFLPLQQAVKNTDLPDDLREAVITFVSMKNGCRYCTKSHASLLEGHTGVEGVEEWLDDYEASSMSEQWKAVLHYAERLTAKPVEVDQDSVNRLKKAGFSVREIAVINHTVAYTSYTNQLSMGLGL